MSGIPYLGSKISLISKSEIRYEGILVDVNAQDSTITFEQVRFFGTEGRRPGDEIAPMDRIFECVVFRSADIKDLQVYETAAAAVNEPVEEPAFPDPAVVSIAKGSQSSASNTATTVATGFQYKTKASTSAASDKDVVKMPTKPLDYASATSSSPTKKVEHPQQQSQTQSYSSNYQSSNKSFVNRPRGGSAHTGGQGHQYRPARVVVPDSEFDFSESNAKFNRDESTSSTSMMMDSKSQSAEQVGPSYNKNVSFFDDISCQANSEKFERTQNERHLNIETFGQAAPQRRYGTNTRGGRGGRGGRGYHGHSSNYRGGYNSGYGSGYGNNSNSNNNTGNQQSNQS